MKETIISSAALILAVCFLRAVLNERASARLRYALWGLVLLRLLVPVTPFDSPVSVVSIYERSELSEALIPVERVTLPYVPGVNGSVAPEDDPVKKKWDTGEDVPPFQIWIHDEDTDSPTTEYIFLEPWEDVAARYLPPVWLGGSILAGLWFLCTNLRFRLRLRRSRVEFDVPERCRLPVYVTGCVASPCMTGLFRPAIYLTPEAAEDPQKRRHILAHELCHHAHGDHIWTLLRCICLTVYWWNPLVWLAAVLSRTDCELACDEGAVAKLGEAERTAYGHTLLDMAIVRQGLGTLLRAGTSIGAGKREMQSRISALTTKRGRITVSVAAAVLLSLIVAGCSFIGAEKTAEPLATPEPTTPLVNIAAPDTEADKTAVRYAFDQAAEAMGWFTGYGEIQFAQDGDIYGADNLIYSPVAQEDISTLKDLETYLKRFFDRATCETLLAVTVGETGVPLFREFGGRLCCAKGVVGLLQLSDCSYVLYPHINGDFAEVTVSWNATLWGVPLEGAYTVYAQQGADGVWRYDDSFWLPIQAAVKEYQRLETEGRQKEILTCERRDGDILLCYDGNGKMVRVPVNGLLTAEALSQLDEECLIVVTYSERTEEEIYAQTLKIGVSAEDWGDPNPNAPELLEYGSFTAYHVSEGSTTVAKNLPAEENELLRNITLWPLLSSDIDFDGAVDLSTLTDYCLVVLDYAGLREEEQSFAGSYYIYMDTDSDYGYSAWIQTMDGAGRVPIGQNTYDRLVRLVTEQGELFID
jgi:beta-lactamase regulating signal transducer with metallopeptidase domain